MTAPASKPSYQTSRGTGAGSAVEKLGGFASGEVAMWFDSTDTDLSGGAPRPVSTEFPMPVQMVGGGSGGAGGGSVTQGTTPWIVQDSAAETALGTPTDTAASGTSNGSVIAMLKQLRALLTGTLSVTDAATEIRMVALRHVCLMRMAAQAP